MSPRTVKAPATPNAPDGLRMNIQRATVAPPVAPRNPRIKVAEVIAHYAAPITRTRPQLSELDKEERLLARARKVLERRLGKAKFALGFSGEVRDFLQFELAEEAREVFCVLFLNAQHQVISFEPMFVGTLTETAVYPREVVRRALELSAAAVILAHNHPSGKAAPSKADIDLTRGLSSALELIDVKVLDHFIVAGAARPLSFMEKGLL